MRRFSTIALSVLTVVLGLTAWAQTQRQQKAPRAVGDLTFESAVPADGQTVESLSEVDFYFSSNDMDYKCEYRDVIGNVVDSEGNKVADLLFDELPDYLYLHCVVSPEVTTPGSYVVTLNENIVYDYTTASLINGKVELHYTIAEAGTPTAPVMVSSTPSTPQASVNQVTVTFDQKVLMSMMALRTLFDINKDGALVEGVSASLEYNPEASENVVFNISEPITTPGEYTIVVPEEMFADETGEAVNVAFTVPFTVKGASSEALTFTTKPANGSTIDEATGSLMLNLAFKKDVTCAAQTLTMVNNETQETYEAEVSVFMGTTVLVKFSEIPAGTWSIDIPKGFFKDADGAENDAMTLTYTIIRQGGGNDDDPRKLEILSAKLVKTTGEEILLSNNNALVANIEQGDVFVVEPNIIDAITMLNLAISHMELNQETGVEEELIDRRMELKDKSETALSGEVYGRTIEFTKGMTYTITIDAEDTYVAPQFRKDWGTAMMTFTGNGNTYEYSPAKIENVSPALGSEITDPEQVFTVTFSQPVFINKNLSGYALGSGAGLGNFASLTSNSERTEWYFTLSPSTIMDEKAGFNIAISAYDDNGLVVKGDNGDGATSTTVLNYECHLGCPAVIITPAAGTVESLFSFTAVAEDGDAIQLGSGADKPYITTVSGARVAEVDMASEVKYDANGNAIVLGGDVSDVAAVKIEFNLDKEITAPGKYILHCPFAAFGLGEQFVASSSRTMNIAYIIEGTPEIAGATFAEGAKVSELTYAGFYINSEVELVETNDRLPSITLRDSESSLGSYTINTAVTEGVTFLFADFMAKNDNQPLALTPGEEYTLSIPKDRVKLAGTDMMFPAMTMKITGVAGNAEFVKLTSDIAGYASAVAQVAKGQSAEIALTAPEGWKVSKVTLDGADVTSNVAGGIYKTPALDSDATVTVLFAYDGELFTPSTSADVVTDFNLRAWSENGEIIVAGLQNGMVVNVYTVNGAHAGSYTVADNDILNVKVPEGVYVITVAKDGKTQAIKLQNK